MSNPSRYRLYIDESGDHTFDHCHDDAHRYLGLVGLWFEQETAYKTFALSMRQLKEDVFGLNPDEGPVCLHRKDLIARRGPFHVLRDAAVNEEFEARLTEIVRSSNFHLACIVLDKKSHRDKSYRTLIHPYHYCLEALLERYVGWLEKMGARGDVIGEARGKTEDRELTEAFEKCFLEGSRWTEPRIFQSALTSGKLKLRTKENALPGLELADLLAYPFRRNMIAARSGDSVPEDFSATLWKYAQRKLNRKWSTGEADGYGLVWLD